MAFNNNSITLLLALALTKMIHPIYGNENEEKSHPDLVKYTANVTNDLDQIILRLHCKSRDDDLGVHYLQPKEQFGFNQYLGVNKALVWF